MPSITCLRICTKYTRQLKKKTSSTKTRRYLQEIRGKVQRETRAMQNEWWIEKAHEIQSFANKNDMHNFYNAIKTIYGPTNRCITSLKTADGLTLLKDQNTILLRWAEHFNILLNQDFDPDLTILEELPKLPPIHNLSLPPTFQEVLSSARSLKNNKSPGTDNILAELLKEGGYICMHTLYR